MYQELLYKLAGHPAIDSSEQTKFLISHLSSTCRAWRSM